MDVTTRGVNCFCLSDVKDNILVRCVPCEQDYGQTVGF